MEPRRLQDALWGHMAGKCPSSECHSLRTLFPSLCSSGHLARHSSMSHDADCGIWAPACFPHPIQPDFQTFFSILFPTGSLPIPKEEALRWGIRRGPTKTLIRLRIEKADPSPNNELPWRLVTLKQSFVMECSFRASPYPQPQTMTHSPKAIASP